MEQRFETEPTEPTSSKEKNHKERLAYSMLEGGEREDPDPYQFPLPAPRQSDITGSNKENRLQKSQENLKKYHLQVEYKMLARSAPYGVYVLPSFESIHKWNGSIFVRQGHYKNGIFKFVIIYPSSYPNEKPRVLFLSKVYHALVHPQTGEVDLSSTFKTWVSGQHFTLSVLNFLKSMFGHNDYYKVEDSFNPEAANKFIFQFHQFRNEANKCLHLADQNKFKNPLNFSMKFTEYTTVHKKILENLLNRTEKGEQEQAISFTKWFMDTLSKQEQNIYLLEEKD